MMADNGFSGNRVSIRHAAVTIKVVQVDRKKMTLALFKQIPICSFMFYFGEFFGTLEDSEKIQIPPHYELLGRVNYPFKDPQYDVETFHFWVLCVNWEDKDSPRLEKFPAIWTGEYSISNADYERVRNLEQLYIAV